MAKTKCVTNGIHCIAQKNCSLYEDEIECAIGADGLCVYDFPIGKINVTKACRLKVCEDFEHITNAACSVALTGSECISNGKNCIVKAACSSYTS